MAMPVIKGVKTASERFAGAIDTYSIEALMQDGKALQAGTSHFLGQNFAKAFDVKFANKEGKQDYVWATSWGVSTRLMGALIMSHSDDAGMVIPPKLAPLQVVIVPIYKGEEQLTAISEKAKGISVKLDDADTKKPGWKFAEYEMKGIPVRIAMGPRDMENGTVEVARRDTKEKETVALDQVCEHVEQLLDTIQKNLYDRAKRFNDDNTRQANSYEEFKEILDTHGGFVFAHWDGTDETEQKIKEDCKATIRNIPLDNPLEDGVCIYSGKPSTQRVLFAKAY
ncbi:UNVERIFIED_CONTAM: hypothetical protein GTU68_058876 [Idotea baltica]|nr:hypothetical protein [Idotea baltica]